MSFSIQREVSNGTLSTIDLAIEYIDKSDIDVYVDDVQIEPTGGATPYTWSWLTDTRIKIVPNVPNGLVAMIKRTTALDAMFHDFTAGAVFKDQSVDENFTQLLYLTQEAIEGSGATDFYTDVDMHGYRVKNIGAAQEGGDAIPFFQYQSDALGALASRQGAEIAKNLADRYANEAEDVPVEPGTFSAFHWSKKAEVKVSTIGVSSFNGRTGAIVPASSDYNQSDVGLGAVNNTSDADKPISIAQAAGLVAKTSDIGSAKIPSGTTAQRDASPVYGAQRANSTTGSMEWWNGSIWASMGGGAKGTGPDDIFYENSQVVTTNYTLTIGKNAMTAGPITINTGVTVTIPTGQTWSIV